MSGTLFFVGTYTKRMSHVDGRAEGIYVYRWNGKDGSIRRLHTRKGIVNPSFLALHPSLPVLYGISEIDDYQGKKSGAVYAYALDAETGALEKLGETESHGTGPCHVVADRAGAMLVIVNYLSGSVASYSLHRDGSIAEVTSVHQHAGKSVNPERQEGPHPHSANFTPDGQNVVVPDLGLDRLIVYPVHAESRSLGAAAGETTLPPGAGPRHLAFHPRINFAYVSNELDSTVTTLRAEDGGAVLTPIGHASTLPRGAGASTAADIHIHPKGEVLYASNRGHDSIAILGIDRKDGGLALIGCEPTGGRTPRNFMVSPDGAFLYAANQDSGTVTVFAIEEDGRRLRRLRIETIPSPVCLLVKSF